MNILVGWILAGILTLNVVSKAFGSEGEEAMLSLKKRLPINTALENVEINNLITKVSESKRLDAALLLIQALAFNADSNNTDEERSQDEMLPAIYALKKQYGPICLPLLFSEGIQTKQEWHRKRIALAIRSIGSKDQISSFIVVFLLNEHKSDEGKSFLKYLTMDKLTVKMTDR